MSELNYVSKGWGYELWLVNKEEYCGKLLFFKRHKKCSYHHHILKDETFFLRIGELEIIWRDGSDEYPVLMPETQLENMGRFTMKAGDTFHIPPGRRHQMIAIQDSELFEFSTQHFDEDSYRIIKGD